MPQDAPTPADLRAAIRAAAYADEAALVPGLAAATGLSEDERDAIVAQAATLVREVRERSSPTAMEAFLAEYGLSTDEGVGLMCLAEALLRVPDAGTIDELIADKIEPSNWGAHLGHSTSSLVNAATWALMLTGRVLDDSPGPAALLRSAIRRLGEPVVRTAVGRAMQVMGRQFVLGETIARPRWTGRGCSRERATPTPTTCSVRPRAPTPMPPICQRLRQGDRRDRRPRGGRRPLQPRHLG